MPSPPKHDAHKHRDATPDMPYHGQSSNTEEDSCSK